jgi:hypothetical protein
LEFFPIFFLFPTLCSGAPGRLPPTATLSHLMNSLSSTSWRRQRLARLEAEQEDVLGNVMSNVRGEREGRGVAERVAAGKTGGFRDPEFCLVVLVVHSSAGGWQLFLKKTLMIAKKKKKKKMQF